VVREAPISAKVSFERLRHDAHQCSLVEKLANQRIKIRDVRSCIDAGFLGDLECVPKAFLYPLLLMGRTTG
jgi:hypothetical protein